MTRLATPLERAFALARTGTYRGMADIRLQLKREGLAVAQLEGGALSKQLRAICTAARAAVAEDPTP